MPRSQPKKPVAAAADKEIGVTKVALRTHKNGKKSYELGGGLNRHGRYVQLTEIVGRRKNHFFIDITQVDTIVELLNQAVRDVRELPEPQPSEPAGADGPTESAEAEIT